MFQANPAMFDIDAALRDLGELSWRVSQYTGAIAPGDAVVLWRSGPDAGVIGVGRVMGYPAAMALGAAEEPYARVEEPSTPVTRVMVRVTPAPFVPKDRIAALVGWEDHRLIVAPMGTVFPIDDAQWDSLAPLLPELPAALEADDGALPPAFAWQQRRKDATVMPGGYDSYLESLRAILHETASSRPSREDLVAWTISNWGMSETNARLVIGFLLRIGILVEHGDAVAVGDVAARWLDDGDDARVIALLHGRVRFVGELLAETVKPRTDTELLDIANRHYGTGWQTKAQIIRRRGWLQSAGLLVVDDAGRLQTTPAGLALLERLDLHPRDDQVPTDRAGAVRPANESSRPASPLPPPVPPAPPAIRVTESVLALADRFRAAATDGQASEQFERETTEVFRRLGFRSEWRGGSGQTDMLLEADLGKDHKYRVVVDCKASSRGNVSQQIDWDTIDEHRLHHHADHAAVVAAGFGGGRLPDRAQRHDAVLLAVEDLVDLLVQHDRVPLGLETYRLLFTSGTTEDALAAISEIAAEAERRIELMRAVLDQIRSRSPRVGALSARDLELLLSTNDDLPDAVETEIAPLLETLTSPLLGVVSTDERGAVYPASSATTAAARLRLLADVLDPQTAGEEPTES